MTRYRRLAKITKRTCLQKKVTAPIPETTENRSHVPGSKALQQTSSKSNLNREINQFKVCCILHKNYQQLSNFLDYSLPKMNKKISLYLQCTKIGDSISNGNFFRSFLCRLSRSVGLSGIP